MTTSPFPVGSVNEAVYLSLHNFPALYENRTQVLASMFISYGTGYYWHEGRLVDLYEATSRNRTDDEVIHAFPASMLRIREGAGPEEIAYRAQEKADWDSRNDEILAIRHNAESLATTPGPLKHIVEPNDVGPYAHVPADVKPDWAAACEEIVAVAETAWAEELHLAHLKPKHVDMPELSPETVKMIQAIWQGLDLPDKG